MSDQFTRYSTEGYFSRIGGAIKGIVVGIVLFLISFVVLFWNEGRAVHRAQVLEEAASKVITVDAKAVTAANDGKLVHFTGDALGDKLADPIFGVSREGVRLKRVAQMYQWKETKEEKRKKDAVGGKERVETTFKYDTVWEEKQIDSSGFDSQGRAGHENPPGMPFKSEDWTAAKVTVGAYTLPGELVSKISATSPVPVDESMLAGVPEDRRSSAIVSSDQIYLPHREGGAKVSPSNPKVGDLRISFKYVPNGPVTVVAQQQGGTVVAYQAKSGPLLELHQGTETAAVFIQKEVSKNNMLTWVLRLVGFVVMWIGLVIALNPLKVLADVIGIVGDIVGFGIVIMSGLIAFILSLLTIGVAWIFYRPLLGIGLIALAGVGVFLFMRFRKKGHEKQIARSGAPGGFQMTAAPAGVPGMGMGMPLPPVPGSHQGLPPVPR